MRPGIDIKSPAAIIYVHANAQSMRIDIAMHTYYVCIYIHPPKLIHGAAARQRRSSGRNHAQVFKSLSLRLDVHMSSERTPTVSK